MSSDEVKVKFVADTTGLNDVKVPGNIPAQPGTTPAPTPTPTPAPAPKPAPATPAPGQKPPTPTPVPKPPAPTPAPIPPSGGSGGAGGAGGAGGTPRQPRPPKPPTPPPSFPWQPGWGGEFEKDLRERTGEMLSGINLLTTAIEFGVTALKHGLEKGEQIQKASRITGMSTNEIQKFGYAAQMSGVSFEEFVQSVANGNRNLGKLSLEGGYSIVALRRLGVSIEGVRNHSVKSMDVLLKMADAYKKHAETAEMAALGNELFGESFRNMIPMLRQGSAGINAYAKQAPIISGIAVSAAADAKKTGTGIWDWLTTNFAAAVSGYAQQDIASIRSIMGMQDDPKKAADMLLRNADRDWKRSVMGLLNPTNPYENMPENLGYFGIRGAGETTQDVRNKLAENFGEQSQWTEKQKAVISELDKRIAMEGKMDLQKGIFQVASTMQQVGGGDVISAMNRVDSLDAIKNATERSADALEQIASGNGGSSSGTPAPAPSTDIVVK